MSAPTSHKWHRWLGIALAVLGVVMLLVLLFAGGEALARVGGGQSFSGGRSSGGGSSGGGGGDGDLIWLLIWLCIEYPAIGIPLVIVIGGVVVVKKIAGGRRPQQRYTSHHSPRPAAAPRRQARATLKALRDQDANFSEPLFIDFVQLVYARAQELRPSRDADKLRPYLSEKALGTLFGDKSDLTEIRDVIFGATRITQVHVTQQWSALQVFFETNLTEVSGDKARPMHLKERWNFRRKAGVLSPGPDRMRALGCASCGSTAEPRTDGTCPNCDSVRVGGRNQWEVASIQVEQKRPIAAPELSLGGGVEPGTNLPTMFDPDLPARRRAYETRHPDHSWDAFRGKVENIFRLLQDSWSSGDWEKARPHETDALFQVHRFWIERYRRFGLVNRLDDVDVRRMELVKIDMDAYFEAITVRLWASMRDWTERRDTGQIVGGSKTEVRVFTEYWTLIRAVGGKHREDTADANSCPSCSAPLDNVNMAGVCGYCGSKITGGDFDWVLSRIEQDDVYAG